MTEWPALAKTIVVGIFAAFGLGVVLVALTRRLAPLVGLVDRPDPTRKLHRGDIALGGGLALFCTTLIAGILTHFYIVPQFTRHPIVWSDRWWSLLLACGLMLALGIIDDRFILRGKQKLAGQLAIVFGLALMWQPSGSIEIFSLPIELGILSIPLVMFWLLATVNAVNLIDGADGVAGSFGAVGAAGIAAVAFVNGHASVALVAALTSAALASFLCFNRPPATIFLGDAGSMFIGLLLGTLACWSVEVSDSPQNVLIPVALLAVPLFDSVVAILRRVLTGRSIYMADRGHLHHILASQIRTRGWSPMWMLVAFAGLSLVASIGAVLAVFFRHDLFALLAIVLLVSGLIWSRTFGHAEAQLLASHTKRVGGRLVSRVRKLEPRAHIAGVSLQGNRRWEEIWSPLVEFATKNGVAVLKLDLNMPWRHEGYHGYWVTGVLPERAEQWSVRLPVICQARTVGRIEIVGKAEGSSQLESLEAFSFLIGELQPAIEQLVCTLSAAAEGSSDLSDSSHRKKPTKAPKSSRPSIAPGIR
jgi:UDP-GlcNAc:undecaprenyl-phosphate GlcNAc-1-phosphate transferase